ncbi:MAG TPA: N-acyl homoserine lactonase family protein [Allosphingosinicella sp.]|jgi:glyoxylase-like metal-dependent hydrolase (beta-lactamase superfamily II)
MKRLVSAALGFLSLTGLAPPAPPTTGLSLWRLDCGSATINDYNAFFSDTSAYGPGPKEITDSCYLIRDGDQYLLWDTGLPEALIGHPDANPVMTMRMETSIAAQLARIGVRPEQIGRVGISHYHGDHIGQAVRFASAKLLIGKGDLDALRTPGGPDPKPLERWVSGGAPVEAVTGDFDVFGDGRVVMLATPGHTPGHHSLLVRLASGPVILSGDLWHFTEQVAVNGVPPFNTDRAQTLASMDRISRMAANIHARIIIQHEQADIAKLPPFPQAAQ